MKKLTVPRGLQIINCKSITLTEKDIVVVKSWEDFLWLLGGGTTLFRLEQSLYSLSGEVVYIFELNETEV